MRDDKPKKVRYCVDCGVVVTGPRTLRCEKHKKERRDAWEKPYMAKYYKDHLYMRRKLKGL